MEISWHQLTLDLNLPIWWKLNMWVMFSTQFQALSLNLKTKITIFEKCPVFSKFHEIFKFLEKSPILENSYFCLQIQTQELKLRGKHASYVWFSSNWQIQVQCQLMSADFHWILKTYFDSKRSLHTTISRASNLFFQK